MAVQQTLIIVKPDGIAKGLVGQILRAISAYGLSVTDHARLQLKREWVEELYGLERDEVYFTDVVDWVSSSPVLFLRILGEDAVKKVKWLIIGRYPEGIRGRYSENWIKNVVHAPDCEEEAERNLALSEVIFNERKTMDEKCLKGKTIFALTGMSECGKSTVGRYLDSKGVKRLKIVKLFGKVKDKISPDEEFQQFIKSREEKDPYSLWDIFIEELISEMEALGTDYVSIESLYGGGLGPYLKQKLGDHFRMLFVDIPQEIRLNRQIQREHLSSLEEARAMLLPRDEIKEKSGIPALKAIADEVVDNSGTLDQLYSAVDAIIAKYMH